MNHGDGDNDDDVDENYNIEDNDDKFSKLYDDGDIDYESSKDVVRSQINERVESSAGCHGSIDIGAYISHIHNPNLFQWVSKLVVDVEG